MTGLVVGTSSTADSREREEAVISYSTNSFDEGFLSTGYGVKITMPQTPDYTHWFRVKDALCSTVSSARAPPAVVAPAPPAKPAAVQGVRARPRVWRCCHAHSNFL